MNVHFEAKLKHNLNHTDYNKMTGETSLNLRTDCPHKTINKPSLNKHSVTNKNIDKLTA